ncbi:hypothetical protein SLEP1_g39221 [Rubroshorea leprosula]|uniref:Uncharacterized protein n=1 Tax=Rubroshorea leprosula TaxID=152421 RepID=A0AAV5KZX2_9ROSI|nr:hypothetical protein SLEP1_g39221 [Rubroshorea leprosula]
MPKVERCQNNSARRMGKEGVQRNGSSKYLIMKQHTTPMLLFTKSSIFSAFALHSICLINRPPMLQTAVTHM